MWKLVPPRQGKTPYYYVRGKYLGIGLDHSTGTGESRAAQTILKTWRRQAERGEFTLHKAEPSTGALTFAAAAAAYMKAGGDGQYLEPILKAWPTKMLADIDQVAIDTVASELYPKGSAQTRNRQVYTPISAVLKRAGNEKKIRRPKGWKGNQSTSWLEPEQAFALFREADKIEMEFGLFCRFLLYTGMRLNEALSRELRHLNLDRSFVYLDDSKNGLPRGCHLPPRLVQQFRDQPARQPRQSGPIPAVMPGRKGFIKGNSGAVGRPVADAGIPFLKRKADSKLFRFHKGGVLVAMLQRAMKNAGLSFPRRQGGFHIFCHSYGTWMHRYGGLDSHGLTRTNRWADPDSADRYVHTEASAEAKLSNVFPTEIGGQVVELKKDAS